MTTTFTTGTAAVPARADDTAKALLETARAGRITGVHDLIARGAPLDALDAHGYSAVALAAASGHAAVVSALLAAGASAGNPRAQPIIAAARQGDVRVVELLVDHGAPLDARDHLGRGPLYYAAWHGHRDVVAFLLDRGADLHVRDDQGDTALHAAASNVLDPELAHDLIARGARIDVVDRAGLTPIDCAAREGERDLMDDMRRWAAAAAAAATATATP